MGVRTHASVVDRQNRHGENLVAGRVLGPEVATERLKGAPDGRVAVAAGEVDALVVGVYPRGDVGEVSLAVVAA